MGPCEPGGLPDTQSFAAFLPLGIGGQPGSHLRRDIKMSFDSRNNFILSSQSFPFVMY
jgi:hypothetical protein